MSECLEWRVQVWRHPLRHRELQLQGGRVEGQGLGQELGQELGQGLGQGPGLGQGHGQSPGLARRWQEQEGQIWEGRRCRSWAALPQEEEGKWESPRQQPGGRGQEPGAGGRSRRAGAGFAHVVQELVRRESLKSEPGPGLEGGLGGESVRDWSQTDCYRWRELVHGMACSEVSTVQ